MVASGTKFVPECQPIVRGKKENIKLFIPQERDLLGFLKDPDMLKKFFLNALLS